MSKMKTQQNQTEEPIDWAEQVQQHPAFEWMMENRRYIPYLFIALLALIAIGYKLTSGRVAEAETNYQLAESYWMQIQKNIGEVTGVSKQEDALRQLREIVNEYPELQAKYDGLIAQLLLVHGLSDEAEPYAERTQLRTDETQSPAFKEFSDITLLIAKGDHEEALQQSLTLKEKLLTGDEPPLLLPYTMIRIAMLYQGTGQKDLESLAWDEWKQYASGDSMQKPDPAAIKTISTLFSEGDFTLDRYIETRNM